MHAHVHVMGEVIKHMERGAREGGGWGLGGPGWGNRACVWEGDVAVAAINSRGKLDGLGTTAVGTWYIPFDVYMV